MRHLSVDSASDYSERNYRLTHSKEHIKKRNLYKLYKKKKKKTFLTMKTLQIIYYKMSYFLIIDSKKFLKDVTRFSWHN